MSQAQLSTKRRYLNLGIMAWGGGFIYLLPYLRYTFYDPLQAALNVNHTQFGLSMSAYGLMAMLSYWPGGWLADRFSPRKLMTISYLATGLLGFYLATYPSFLMGVLVHALWGVSATLTYWAALIRATKDTAGEDQGRFFGLLEGGRGLFSTLASFSVVGIFALFTDEQEGLRWAIFFMSGGTILAGVLTWFSFNDPKEIVPNPSLKKDIVATFRSPLVWAVAFLVFAVYSSMVMVGAYATPYLTEVFMISTAVVAFWASFWNYGCQLLAGPVGGIVADKIGSRPLVAFVLYVVLVALVLGLVLTPALPAMGKLVIFWVVAVFAALYAIKGIYFALIEDLEIPEAISGGAIGLASMIGFTPDVFAYPLCGWILDSNSGPEGYRIIFTIAACLSAVGVVVSFLVLRHVNQLRRARRSPAAAMLTEEQSA